MDLPVCYTPLWVSPSDKPVDDRLVNSCQVLRYQYIYYMPLWAHMQLRHIIHKAAPLWGMIRINVPLNELEEMASLSSEKWCKELDARIKRLMEAVEQAVKKAKELKYEPDENHIGSRR